MSKNEKLIEKIQEWVANSGEDFDSNDMETITFLVEEIIEDEESSIAEEYSYQEILDAVTFIMELE